MSRLKSKVLALAFLVTACASIETAPFLESGVDTTGIEDTDATGLSSTPGQSYETRPSLLHDGARLTYISEIANLPGPGSSRAYVIEAGLTADTFTLQVTGDRIEGWNFDHTLEFRGVISGNRIRFEIEPSQATRYFHYRGEWEILDNGAELYGKWSHPRHDSGGTWQLVLFEDSEIADDLQNGSGDRALIYTTHYGNTRPFAIDDLDNLFDLIANEDSKHNIVIYIHGWGTKFYSLFEPSAIPNVEAYTRTRFIIFRWPSWKKFLRKPENSALQASASLARFLQALDAYRLRAGSRLAMRKMTLLSHSMGNLVLKDYLERYYRQGQLSSDLLDNLVMTSADVPLKGHRLWLDKIDFAERIFIVQHRRDLVLYLSILMANDREAIGARLGTGFRGSQTQMEREASSQASYLDLTGIRTFSHQHFRLPRADRYNQTGQLFQHLLNGEPIDFPDESIGLVDKHATLPIYYFRRDGVEPELLSTDLDR